MATTAAQALLLVYSDNGTAVADHPFNAWYDDEHIPQRINFPGCTNALRYRGIDSQYPPWAALYHTISPEIPDSPAWKHLNEVASDHEKHILETIPVITRSIYTLTKIFGPPLDTSTAPSGKVICIVHLQVTASSDAQAETNFESWYQKAIIESVSKTPGWVRSHMYKRHNGLDMRTTDALKVAMDCGTLVIHEWNGDAMEVSKLGANVTAQVEIWAKENNCTITRVTRIMSLHREW